MVGSSSRVEIRGEVELERWQDGREELGERKDGCYRRVRADSQKFVSLLRCRLRIVLLLLYYWILSLRGVLHQLELEKMGKIKDHHCSMRVNASYGDLMHEREVSQVVEVVRVRCPTSECSIEEENRT